MSEHGTTALEHTLRSDLRQLHRQLRLIQSSLLVATRALKAQDAENDRDIAQVLEFDVGGRLDAQIEGASRLINSLSYSPTPSDVRSRAPSIEGGGRPYKN